MAEAPQESPANRPPRRRRSPRRPLAPVPAAGEEVSDVVPQPPVMAEAPAARRRAPLPRRVTEEAAPPSVAPNNGMHEEAPPTVAPSAVPVEEPKPAPDGSIRVGITVPRGWARRVSAKLIQAVVDRALELEAWPGPATLDVVMVRDEEMREINATRRGIDEGTDVLSFPLVQVKPGGGVTEEFFVLPPDSAPHLGDVVISIDRVDAQAKEAGHSPQRELAYLTVHGVLHILGYDHENDQDRRQMRKREEEVLSALGLTRPEAEA
ncbi:MAG: rRNA maturation RNase YbeY [Chloroflexi bacterium]|nr:rRNA maturation RNase YbeY [Chloroflexota bacterium]